MNQFYGWLESKSMICVTRLNGKQFYINAEMIQLVESTPDTIITLINNTKYVVKDPAEEIVKLIIAYRQQVFQSKFMWEDKLNKEEIGA